MRVYKTLKPKGLPDEFDANIHGGEPVVELAESKDKIVVSYTFPGFFLSDDARDVNGKEVSFQQINMSKTGFLAENGKPLLPSFGRYVQIPIGYSYAYTVKKGKPVQFDDVLVLPAQEKLTDKHDEKAPLEYNKAFYAKDELYPKELAEVSGPFEIDEYNALLVHVRPCQYNPKKRKLIGYGNITVTITFTAKKPKTDAGQPMDPDLDREAYGNLFINPRRNIEERVGIPGERTMRFPVGWSRGDDFLIIYHDTFRKPAEILAQWKRMRGLRTETVSITSVGNTVSKIKSYIRKKRLGPLSRLRYVLLFGDVDMITAETISGGAYGDNITDYYYSTKQDPTNSTEYLLPWLSIGRIPVRTEAEGIDVVDQIVSYEKDPPADSEYYHRMAFAAYFQDDYPQDGKADRAYMKTMEEIREYLVTLGFDIERIYVSNNANPQQYIDGTPVPQSVLNAIVNGQTATNMLISATSEGQLSAGHRDHGDTNGWSHPRFTKNELNTISSKRPSIFLSINCLTGHFDLVAPTESFAENILRMKGGAPSLIAATRVSHTWLNNDLIRALYDAIWPGVLPTYPGSTASYSVRHNRLGDILNYAKAYLPVKMSGSAQYIKDHYEIYHVIGDPTLEVWKAFPLVVRIRVNRVGSYLTVSLSSCPQGSVITIWWGDRLLKRIEPSSTIIRISLRDLQLFPWGRPSSQIKVCFWAPGCRFVEAKVRT